MRPSIANGRVSVQDDLVGASVEVIPEAGGTFAVGAERGAGREP